MESYAGLTRRDTLQATARLAIERISRELRMALPNSVCTHNGVACDNSGSTLYLLRTKDAGEYQDRGGQYYPGQSRNRLPIAGNTANTFDVISSNTLNAAANDWVVVYNTDNADIYSTTDRRKQISSVGTKDVDAVAPNDDIAVINLTSTTSFPNHSPGRRFQIIENNATLFYLSGTDLFRARSSFASPTTPTAGSEHLLLENVTACSFTYLPGSLHRSGLLRIALTVTASGESINLTHEAQVYNAP
jgi:MSHA biogenesis protein MshO